MMTMMIIINVVTNVRDICAVYCRLVNSRDIC